MLRRKVEKKEKKIQRAPGQLCNRRAERLSCAASGMKSACDFNLPTARESSDPSFGGSKPASVSKMFLFSLRETAQVLGFVTVLFPIQGGWVVCFHAACEPALDFAVLASFPLGIGILGIDLGRFSGRDDRVRPCS